MGKGHFRLFINILKSVKFHSYFKILKPFKPKCFYVSVGKNLKKCLIKATVSKGILYLKDKYHTDVQRCTYKSVHCKPLNSEDWKQPVLQPETD